jgi:YidC/Oxa1 family membrane protein insertase
MAQSQKYMMYIVPFFSLTGLYWQYGLVLYWVTTNVWTLGQQFFMFRNWAVIPTGKAAVAVAAATTGITGRTTQSSPRSGSGTAKTAADGRRSGSGAAKTPAGGARVGSASSRPGSSSTRPAAAGNGSAGAGYGSAANGSGGAANGSGGARTGSARRPATVTTPPVQPPVVPATGQNGGEKRGLLRLGRQKPEPAPEPQAPTVRVVRQQPVRQAKGKRSGNKR